jgi:hypothetical protein
MWEGFGSGILCCDVRGYSLHDWRNWREREVKSQGYHVI